MDARARERLLHARWSWPSPCGEPLRPSTCMARLPARISKATREGGQGPWYTRAGLSVPEVTFLERWRSNLVLEYEAWEDRSLNTERPAHVTRTWDKGFKTENEVSRLRPVSTVSIVTRMGPLDVAMLTTFIALGMSYLLSMSKCQQ